MTRLTQAHPDKAITRQIHRLFWKANFIDKTGLIITYLARIPANLAYNTFIPLVSAYAIQAIVNRQLDEVKKYAVWVLLLAVFYIIAWTIGGLYVSRNASRGTEYIQRTVLNNFLHKDYEFYTNNFSGSLGAQVASLRDAYNTYGMLVTLSIPKQATIVLSGIGIIAYQSWLLAVVTFIAMLLVLGFTIASSRWRLRFRRLHSEATSVVAAHVGDALGQGTTVKSFAAEEYEQEQLKKPIATMLKAQYLSWVVSLPADAGRMLLAAIATAILLVVSAKLYIDGAVSLTIVVLIQLYVVKLIAATLDIAEIVKQYEFIMGSAYQPLKTMSIEPTIIDEPSAKKLSLTQAGAIQFDQVSYTYEGTSTPAIENFSLNIAPGEKIGIVGYSGSGKTTLTKLLVRFMDVTSGSILVDASDIRTLTQASLRRHIAYVPQEPLLFHRSISENIAYGRPSASKNDILNAAKAAFVTEFTDTLPHKLDTIVGERGIKLSGGQRQRVAIARALLKDAPLLVLDEATSALDSRSEQFIQKALWKLMKDRTAIVIAHRLSTIQRMDRIAVMDKGSIVQIGTHAELLKKKGVYAELWAHQSGGYIGIPESAPIDANTTSQK